MTDDALIPASAVQEAVVRCSGCGRPLRDPASRARGHGPVCTELRLPEPPRVTQEETLPGL
ncbi:hypothetical protein DN069_24170 [Streptacidiphilus pinicola]|uniref:Uncharacterized protein n=1 Tax=Streptacidiphilus pinicola TaxID=2219663 RepID=A0A2X0IDL2_9ACTN|nr:DUF6011 domain-containing protein [Streptacidiphilus pinicola]RAG83074.1 hypothetical protein DN069_24170 [Streptacidiphilus pinicola]